jgi:hypothetical protein
MKNKWLHLAAIGWVLWCGYTVNGKFEWYQIGSYASEEECEFFAAFALTLPNGPEETACVEG